MRRAKAFLSSTSRLGLLATLVLAPLPFGSAEPAWIVVWCAVLALVLLAADTSRLTVRDAAVLSPVLAAAAAFGAVVLLQSLPPGVILPANPAFADASRLLERPVPAFVAATASPPWTAAGASLCFLLALLNGFVLGKSASGSDLALRLLVVAGCVYVALGVANAFIDPTLLLWRPKRYYLDSVTGPFVNRNTAATYFGSCAAVALLVALRSGRRDFADVASWREALGIALDRNAPRTLIVFGVASAICLVGVLMTGSRAGTLLTAMTLVLATLLFVRRLGWGMAGMLLALLALVGVAFEFFGGSVAGRIASRGLGDVSRADTYLDALQIIAGSPWYGTGLGTFEEVYPPFRTSIAPGTMDKAHSTPLELAVELGLPVTAAIGAAGLFVTARLVRASLIRQRDRRFALSALAVGLLGTAHSLVDFSLQIPGYAIPFAIVVGIGLANSSVEA